MSGRGSAAGRFVNEAYFNNVDALVWRDTSAEQAALYRQAFHWARWRVETLAKTDGRSLKPRYCVFTDCDETILDNSEFHGWLQMTGRNFHPLSWNDFCNARRSRACPGAVPFAIWLAESGIELFYVTSRSSATRAATVDNLAMLGFPVTASDASEDPMVTRVFMADMPHPDGAAGTWTRWQQYEWITAHRRLQPLLWLGDNLSDFRSGYKDLRWDLRRQLAEGEDRENWGTRFVVMPNPVYGDWMRNYTSLRDGRPLVDDAGSLLTTPLPVREPVLPTRTPKIAELAIWPEWR